MFALQVTDVRKRYGRRVALDGLSLTVPQGSVCALVGPNGAGKTTTMSIVGGFVQPDTGSVDLLGKGPFSPVVHRGRVGILPQDAELLPNATPRQLLSFWAGLQGMGPSTRAAAVSAALDVGDLQNRADQVVSTLSHGMRRRLMVASAMLGEPELVLLDEPTAGLDPVQAFALRQRIAAERGRRTVLISSHNLLELETLCDHVIFIDQGRCVRSGPMSAITGADREVRVRLAPPYPPGRPPEVHLRLSKEDPRSLAEATTTLLRELLDEGALIQDVQRGESLERRYVADTLGGP